MERGIEQVERSAAEAFDHPGPARDFILLSSGQFVSSAGTWMQKTAIGWLTWELTHSPAWVGAISLVDVISALWVAPLAGALADRTNPYRLLRVTQSALMLSAIALAAVTMLGWTSIWLLWLFALLDSTLEGFSQPSRGVAIHLLAGKARISQAIATNSIAIALARSVGPAVAGVSIATVGAGLAFAGNALSYLAVLFVLGLLAKRLDRKIDRSPHSFRTDVAVGFRYVLETRHVAIVFALAAAFSLFARPLFELLPAFAGAVFGGGPHVLATLLTVQGLGALAGAITMLRARPDAALVRMVAFGGLTFVAAGIAFTTTDWLPLAALLMGLAGIGHVLCNISLQSLVQLRAAPDMRGRAISTYMLLFRAGPSLGAFVLGLLAGLVPLSIGVGVSLAIAGLAIATLARRARSVLEPSSGRHFTTDDSLAPPR